MHKEDQLQNSAVASEFENKSLNLAQITNPYLLRTDHFDDFDDSDDSALTQDISITIMWTSFKTQLWIQNLKIKV